MEVSLKLRASVATAPIYARNSIRHIMNGNAPRNEEENRIYGMKRGLDFIADQQNEITEENLHQLYQISTGEYLPSEDKLLPDHFYRHDAVYIVGGEESRKGLSDELLPQVMKQLIDFANAEDDLNELHKAAILHLPITTRILTAMDEPPVCFTCGILHGMATRQPCLHRFRVILPKARRHIIKPMSVWRKMRCSQAIQILRCSV